MPRANASSFMRRLIAQLIGGRAPGLCERWPWPLPQNSAGKVRDPAAEPFARAIAGDLTECRPAGRCFAGRTARFRHHFPR